MGVMKGLYITIHNGGDEAVAAVQRVSEDWLAQLEQAASEIERLRAAIRRLAEQDATLSIVNGVICADDEAVCDIGQQSQIETPTIQPVTQPLPVRKQA